MSNFDPLDPEKIFRPGCEYESILKQRRGEPELEKVQFQAFEQQKLLRKDKKDIVSAAIVNMPKTFLKPFDYSIDLLVRSHPTLRQYTDMRKKTEVDPDYALNTSFSRQRIEPRDEIMLRNNVGNKQGVAIMNMTRSVSGAFVNTVDVVTQYLPGNFGVRVIETMPTNLSEVWRERKTTQNGTTCLQFMDGYKVPSMLDAPLKVDYPTDEDSDDGAGFSIKIPDLSDLIVEFEKDDDAIFKAAESVKQTKAENKAKGLEFNPRDVEIKDDKKDKIAHLDLNIAIH